MRIIDLIDGLQKLRASYDDKYLATMGEPEIMLDVFIEIIDEPNKFRYSGIGNEIKIEKSDDGVYDIISSFASSYKKVMSE
jgi:hypothetical protein